MHNIKMLVVDDEIIAMKNLVHVLKKEGYDVHGVTSGVEALKALEKEPYHVVLTDLRMEKVDGRKVLEKTKALYPDTEVIMITGYATVDSAVDAIKAGAYHYLSKPYKLEDVRQVVSEVVSKLSIKFEAEDLREEVQALKAKNRIITRNVKMKKLLETAKQIAQTDSNVIIIGESGTGKELLAKFIHAESLRKDAPMLSVNCGAFSEELLTNELFGHEKGAFTGANEQKKGIVELADKGTLFLDEVTEMSPTMQVKLLRVIQEKEVMKVGGSAPIKIDVRFLAATNRDLQAEVRAKNFRQDLYFRLNVVSLVLPPLAQRKEDIPLLIMYFLQKYSQSMHKDVKGVTPKALEVLMQYDFPGNIRELENIIERGIALTDSDTIDICHLPDDMRGLKIQTIRKSDGELPTLEEQEKAYIEWVLSEAAGNKTEAARILGIDRVSLWRKLKRYELE